MPWTFKVSHIGTLAAYLADIRPGLRISTLHLSLAIERELLKSGADNGRAMVFGSFPTEASDTAQAP